MVKEKDLFTVHEVMDIFNVQPSPCTLQEEVFSLRSRRLCGGIVFLVLFLGGFSCCLGSWSSLFACLGSCSPSPVLPSA